MSGTGEVAAEHRDAGPQAAPEAVAEPPAAFSLGAGLSPATVLALHAAAGNRAVGQVLARAAARSGVRAIARTPSVSDEVFRVSQELAKKQPPDKPVVDDAVAVATRAWNEATRLKGAGAGADKVEDAYKEVKRVVSALMANGAEDAAIAFARTADAEVQTGALNTLRGHVSGVANQQHFASKAAKLAGLTVPEATAGQSSADWLEKQTQTAGQAFKKLEEMGVKGLPNESGPLSLTLVSQLLSQYFTHAPDDVKPDPGGKVGKLKADATSKQLEADCDVYAAYGARLLRAAGWQTVGYMAFVPADSTGRDAHAVALAKRTGGAATEYASLSNAEVKTFSAASDDAARDPLLAHALAIYSSPQPAEWKAYYSPAGANGAYDLKLLDPENKGLTPFRTQP